MINILRKNQKALWIVIALLCIPFVFYFSNSKVGPIGNNEFGKIYGRAIPIAEFQHHARLFILARDLGMQSFLQDMVAGATSENEAYAEFTWNQLILRHEAEQLGIRPEPKQIVTFAWKDYADGAKRKTMALEVKEFLRRFCLHLLPKAFVKIRHFGFLSNRQRQVQRQRLLVYSASSSMTYPGQEAATTL